MSQRHRLADTDPISLGSLENETLLLFPRELAPAYYDRIIAAFEGFGFEPRVVSFTNPPPQAMLARLRAGNEVGVPPVSLLGGVGWSSPPTRCPVRLAPTGATPPRLRDDAPGERGRSPE